MSETAPPSTDLNTARRHLERKGYLRGGLPPSPPAAWQHAAFLAALWAAASATVVGGTLARTGAAWSDVGVVAAAVAPLVALMILVAVVAGRRAAVRLLGWGGSPRPVAAAFGGMAGLVALAGITASVGGNGAGAVEARLAVGACAATCAVVAGLATRRGLLRTLGGDDSTLRSSCSRRIEVAALFAAAGAGVGIAALPPGEIPLVSGSPAFAAPAASGRVAVVGVDGLSREDLEALAILEPGEGWGEIAGWGWVKVEGAAAPLPAVTWISIACGASPREHGVFVLEEVQLFGRTDGVVLPPVLRGLVVAAWSPFSAVRVAARPALDRRLPTLWEMASRAGCPVLVGGWWGSWPVRHVLGEVVSERAWLGGATGADAVTPALADAVRAAWKEGREAPAATDLLAEDLVRRAASRQGPSLVALWLPGLDLTTRLAGATGTLAAAARLRPHLVVLRGLLERLADGGYAVWLVGIPQGAGAPFAASKSVLFPGGRGSASTAELVAAWLDQLGLPPPAGGALPRSDLRGRVVAVQPAVEYGPPPAPVVRPSAASAAVQREVLRSLGYLR